MAATLQSQLDALDLKGPERTGRLVDMILAEAVRALWWTPLFVSRLETDAPGLMLYSGMPQVWGPLRIRVGRDVRMSGISTLIGRSSSAATPELDIGDNVDIGWQCQLSVGTKIVIGDNVRLFLPRVDFAAGPAGGDAHYLFTLGLVAMFNYDVGHRTKHAE